MDRLKQVLAAAIRHGQYGAVLFLDLDNFKMINDSLGHPVGDTLLQQVANRLDSQFRSEDTVARVGGDEFIVLLPRLGEDMERAAINAQIVAEKLLGTLTRPFLLRGQRYQINGSIGVVVFPDAGDSADDIVKRADTAMYQSKGSGKNAIRYYNKSKPVSPAPIC